jgi:hypothetical protein
LVQGLGVQPALDADISEDVRTRQNGSFFNRAVWALVVEEGVAYRAALQCIFFCFRR